jgi:hypothetical protein
MALPASMTLSDFPITHFMGFRPEAVASLSCMGVPGVQAFRHLRDSVGALSVEQFDSLGSTPLTAPQRERHDASSCGVMPPDGDCCFFLYANRDQCVNRLADVAQHRLQCERDGRWSTALRTYAPTDDSRPAALADANYGFANAAAIDGFRQDAVVNDRLLSQISWAPPHAAGSGMFYTDEMQRQNAAAKQLRALLAAATKRSVPMKDCYKHFDEHGLGVVARRAFRRGMLRLGLKHSPDIHAALFVRIVVDGRGMCSPC